MGIVTFVVYRGPITGLYGKFEIIASSYCRPENVWMRYFLIVDLVDLKGRNSIRDAEWSSLYSAAPCSKSVYCAPENVSPDVDYLWRVNFIVT
jgi:hypothetical protein